MDGVAMPDGWAAGFVVSTPKIVHAPPTQPMMRRTGPRRLKSWLLSQYAETRISCLSYPTNLIGLHHPLGFATACGHLHAAASLARTVSSPASANTSARGGSSPGGKVDAEASTVRKRLQQATNVARKRDTGSKCRHGCRHLQRLTVIDAIGNRVIVAAAGDAGSRDHQFGPPAAAAN
jgi:hypothetical protein